jgi:hypothetical protein
VGWQAPTALPNADERHTLGLGATPVARDGAGFSNDSGGPEGVRRRILEARARRRLLGGVGPGVAHASVPPPVTTSAFPRHERRRQTSLGASGGGSTTIFLCYFVYIFMPTSIGFYDMLSVYGSPSIFCMFMIFLFTFLRKRLLIFT